MTASEARTLVLDRAAVRAADRAAIEEYGIPGIVLMENAARGLAAEALHMLRSSPSKPASALIVCGSGNNGGDGYALARHLHNAQVRVTLLSLGEPRLGTDAATNLDICRKMSLEIASPDRLNDFAPCELIVDAIFGTGLDRPVEGEAARMIDWINAAGQRVLAADVPSGMDCDTGEALGRAVRAEVTVTFVALKPGLLTPAGGKLAGRVVVADIGAPRELVERLGRASARPRARG